jgi:ribonuclease D
MMAGAAAELIETTQALAEWCRVMDRSEWVALDTEGDSLHCYFEKLCLIQVGLPGHNILIDPLARIDLSLLADTLQARKLVLHGCDYDLRMLRRSFGFVATNVFDTYLAARLTGLTEVGYASLVKRFFGVELPKSSQKANWAKRPLTRTMQEYAENDTRYLLDLREELSRLLLSKRRSSWFEETCQRAIAAAASDRDRDPETSWKIAGSAALRGRAAALLRELWIWRDSEARETDRPAFQILRNEDLIRIAQKLTDSGSADLPDHLPAGRRRRLQLVIDKALQLPESAWPQNTATPRPRPTSEQERRFEQLKSRRDRLAAELELDPGVLAPRQALERIARDPGSKEEVLMNWQSDLLQLGG